MAKKTFYDVLQVSPNADPEIIKAAYSSFVQRFHPDKNPSNPDAEKHLKIINRAYEVLSDPVKREGYDAALVEDVEDESNLSEALTSKTDETHSYVTTGAKRNNMAIKWGLYAGWLIVWLILQSIMLVMLRKNTGGLVVGLATGISIALFISVFRLINKHFSENQPNQPDAATSTKETISAPEAIPSKENAHSSVPDQPHLMKGDATTFPKMALEIRNVLLLLILGIIVAIAIMTILFPPFHENKFSIGYSIGYWLGVAVGPRHSSHVSSGILLTMMLTPGIAYILYKIRLPFNTPADDSVQESGRGILGLYQAIIGEKNTSYYTTKFEQFDRQGPGIKASWNWPAFFFTGFWALYRKMYGWFFALWGVAFVETFFAKAGAFGYMYIILLAAHVAFGIYANSIYHRHVRKKIAAAKLTVHDEPKLLAYLRDKGGVSSIVLWLGLVPIVGILAAIAIPAYNDYQQRAAESQSQQPVTGGYSPNDTLVDGASPQSQQPATPRDLFAERADLMKRAEQGDAVAQNELAWMYYKGRGVPQDYAQAALWLRKAAEQGHATAQYNLGGRYGRGEGVPKDENLARFWNRKAAEQGFAAAQKDLGVSYFVGRDVPQDYVQSVYWGRKAAEQGDAQAQLNLGVMYGNGLGVPQDFVQAYMWANLAAAGAPAEDREIYAKNREAYGESMTPLQTEQAQALTRDWLAKHPR